VAGLEGHDLNGLRRQWRSHLGGAPPAHLPRWLVMRVLAYRLQADAFGGLKAGALLVREWNGKLERVMVLDEGFAWNGRTFSSLSQIAKAMTGTNWNGHRFFGLRQGKVDAAGHGRDRRKGEASAGARTAHGASLARIMHERREST